MGKKIKILTYTLLSLVILGIIAVFVANFIVKKRIENYINEDLPNNMMGSYGEVSVNTLDGTVLLTNPVLIIGNKQDRVEHTFFHADKLLVSGFGYLDFFFKNEIHIDKLSLDTPTFEYYKDLVVPDSDTVHKKTELKNPILVEELQFHNSKFTIFEKDKDSTKLYAENVSLRLTKILVNQEIVKGKIPFEYKELQANGDSLFLKADPYDNLTIQNFSMENKDIVLNQLKYYTKYSKKELSRIINEERDHYNLSIQTLSVQNFDYGFNDTLFFAKIKNISINTPKADIFRDKLVADDLSVKSLYSKSLRELPFDLTIDSVKIRDGFLEYDERVHKENSGGSIQFKDLNADITNLSNTYKSPLKTEIIINSIFMENTPLKVDWSFDVQNELDQFIFKAQVGSIQAERLNRFTEPNLKVRLGGYVHKTYFTIDGNNDFSNTDLKMNYSDFKVTVLKRDGKNKNKFLSAVVNIFVSKDSERKEDKFREATGKATRNKTKSVFNLFWISVQSALQKILI